MLRVTSSKKYLWRAEGGEREGVRGRRREKGGRGGAGKEGTVGEKRANRPFTTLRRKRLASARQENIY